MRLQPLNRFGRGGVFQQPANPDGHLMPAGPVSVSFQKMKRKMHTSTRGVTGPLLGSILPSMNFNAVIERDLETGLLVGSVPGIPGAHTQGETIEEVRANLAEVIELLQSQDALDPESEFIATTSVMVA